MRIVKDGKIYFKGTGYFGGEYRICHGEISMESMKKITNFIDTYTEIQETILKYEEEKKMADKSTLNELYNNVFDENGQIKICGRQACIDLITFMNKMTHSKDNFGNAVTGQMNVEAIKEYMVQM